MPLDGQQPLAQQTIAVGGLGGPGAHQQPAHHQYHGPVLVHQVDVGLDVGAARGHPRQAVVGVARRSVGTQAPHPQGQQQTAIPHPVHRRVGRNGLETGIQQCGVHAIASLLGTDSAGQADLGQHGAHRTVRDMRGGQAGERRTELHTTLVEPLAQLVALEAARIRRQQGCDILGGWLCVGVGVQDRGGAPHLFAVLVCLHDESGNTGRLHGRHTADRRLLVQQQHLFEADVADFRLVPENPAARGQCHFAVGGPGKRGYVVYLVIAQPRQRGGADLALPGMPLRLLHEPYVRAQQGMYRNGTGEVSVASVMHSGAMREQQATVRPRRQGRIHQLPAGTEHREVHRRAGAVQLAHHAAQPVRHRLLAPHDRDGGDRDVESLGGLLHGTRQQRMGESSPNTRCPSSRAARTAAENRTMWRRLSDQ